MSLTELQQDLLKSELASNGNKVAKAAGALGLDLEAALQFVEGNKPTVGIPRPRPELEAYVIATTRAGVAWPRNAAIDEARQAYDQGLVELCQWRDGDDIHLLKIPRQKRDRGRIKYFQQPASDFEDLPDRRKGRRMRK